MPRAGSAYVDIYGDLAPLRRSIREAAAELRRLSKEKGDPKLGLDKREFDRKLAEGELRLKALMAQRTNLVRDQRGRFLPNADVDIDRVRTLNREINALQSGLQRRIRPGGGLDFADLAKAATARAALEKDVRFKIGPDLSQLGVAKVLAEKKTLEKPVTIPIRFQIRDRVKDVVSRNVGGFFGFGGGGGRRRPGTGLDPGDFSDKKGVLVGLGGSGGSGRLVQALADESLPKLTTVALIAEGALASLAAAAVGLGAALEPLIGILGAIPAGIVGLGQVAGSLFATFSGIGTAVKAAGMTHQKFGTDAAAALETQQASSEKVRRAEEALSKAQDKAQRIQDSLTGSHQEAARALEDLKNKAEDAALAELDSTLSLREAKEALRKAESDPGGTGLDIERAQLGVKQARRAAEEARQQATRAQQDLQKSPAQGAAKLEAANKAVEESTKRLTRAQESAQFHTSRLSSSQQALKEAMAELSPAGQHFVRFLDGLRPKLKAIRDASQEAALPHFEKGITAATKNLPLFQTALTNTSRILGVAGERFGKFVGSKGFGKDFQTITRANNNVLRNFGRALIPLGKAFNDVGVAAAPFVRWLGRVALHLARLIAHSAKAGRESGGLAHFLHRTRNVLEDLGKILGHVVHGLGGLFGASFSSGKSFLDLLVRITGNFDDWANSLGGQNSIKKFMDDARGPLKSFGDLLASVSTLLLDLIKAPGGGFFFKSFTFVFTQLARVLDVIAKIPGIGGLAANLVLLALAAQRFGSIGTGVRMMRELSGGILGISKAENTLTRTFGLKIRDAFSRLARTRVGEEISGRIAQGLGLGAIHIRRALDSIKGLFKRILARVGIGAGEQAAENTGQTLAASTLPTGKLGKLQGRFKNLGKRLGAGIAIGMALGLVLFGPEIFKELEKIGTSIGKWARDFTDRIKIKTKFGIPIGFEIQSPKEDALEKLKKAIGFVPPASRSTGLPGMTIDSSGKPIPGSKKTPRKAPEKIGKGFDDGRTKTVEIETPVLSLKAGDVKKSMDRIIVALRGKLQEVNRLMVDWRERWERTLGRFLQGTDDPLHLAHRLLRSRDEATRAVKKIRDNIVAVFDDLNLFRGGDPLHLAHSILRSRDEATRAAKSIRENIEAVFRDMRLLPGNDPLGLGRAITHSRDEATRAAKGIRTNIGSVFEGLSDVVGPGITKMMRIVGSALRALGGSQTSIKRISTSIERIEGKAQGGFVKRMAQGGLIQGQGLQDTVPLHLPAGSVVENRHQQPIIDFALAMADRLRYAVGGLVPILAAPGERVRPPQDVPRVQQALATTAAAGIQPFGSLEEIFGTIIRPHYMAKGGEVPRRFKKGGQVGPYVYPIGPGLSLGRTDQGVDFSGAGPIATIGRASFTRVQGQNTGTGWPGAKGEGTGAMIVYRLTDGPERGRYVYLAENVDPTRGLRRGSKLGAGKVYAHARGQFPFLEIGWSNAQGVPTGRSEGYTRAHEFATRSGKGFQSFISGLSHGELKADIPISPHIRTRVRGPAGAIRDLVSGAVGQVRVAANRRLSRESRAPVSTSRAQGAISFGTVERLAGRAGIHRARLFAHIAEAESTLRPGAMNRSGATGLWQIMMPLHQAALRKALRIPGLVRKTLLDPFTNARAADFLSSHGRNLAPWAPSRGKWGQFAAEGGFIEAARGYALPFRPTRRRKKPRVIRVPHRGPTTAGQQVELRRVAERRGEQRTGEPGPAGDFVQLRRIRERAVEKRSGHVPGAKRDRRGGLFGGVRKQFEGFTKFLAKTSPGHKHDKGALTGLEMLQLAELNLPSAYHVLGGPEMSILDSTSLRALREYTQEHHASINRALRGRGPWSPEITDRVSLMDRAFWRANRLTREPEVVLRGVPRSLGGKRSAQMRFFDRLRPGQEFVDRGWVSTTTQPHTAEFFEQYLYGSGEAGEGGYALKIRLPKGSRYLAVGGPEQEALLGRSSRYKVLSKRHGQVELKLLHTPLKGFKPPPQPDPLLRAAAARRQLKRQQLEILQEMGYARGGLVARRPKGRFAKGGIVGRAKRVVSRGRSAIQGLARGGFVHDEHRPRGAAAHPPHKSRKTVKRPRHPHHRLKKITGTGFPAELISQFLGIYHGQGLDGLGTGSQLLESYDIEVGDAGLVDEVFLVDSSVSSGQVVDWTAVNIRTGELNRMMDWANKIKGRIVAAQALAVQILEQLKPVIGAIYRKLIANITRLKVIEARLNRLNKHLENLKKHPKKNAGLIRDVKSDIATLEGERSSLWAENLELGGSNAVLPSTAQAAFDNAPDSQLGRVWGNLDPAGDGVAAGLRDLVGSTGQGGRLRDVTKEINAYNTELQDLLPGGKLVIPTAEAAGAQSQSIAEFMKAIVDLLKKGSNISPVPQFARGGTMKQPFALVGEEGPEIVKLPIGSRVFSHPDSIRMADVLKVPAFAGGGVMQAPAYTADRPVTDEHTLRALIEALKKGGDKEVVLNKYGDHTTVVMPEKEKMGGYAHAAEIGLRHSI